MKQCIYLLLFAVMSLSCNGQATSNKKDMASATVKKSQLKPEGTWQVNKEFDENGNLIKFDSIYSWSSSDQLKGMDKDSIFHKMQSMMHRRFSMLQSPSMNSFIDHDSIMKQFFSEDVFGDRFFSNHSPLGMPQMNDFMKRMEAIRQQFFNDNHRYVIPPVDHDN